MSQAALHNTQSPDSNHPLEPNVLQRTASDPAVSSWVGASAGSGKTKVLTDRILRLLLPDNDGRTGTKPHKILALTFTKAGAGEMRLRIQNRLSEWAVMPLTAVKDKKGLSGNLKNLLGQEPTSQQIDAARKLFAEVVDVPGGLKIMTIHSFCQSILSRFPLEADLPPNFKALEESQAQNFLRTAQQAIIRNSGREKASPLTDAIYNVASSQNEDQFMSLLSSLISERRQFEKILKNNFGVDGLYERLCNKFGIPAGQSAEQILLKACADEQFDEQGLRHVCSIMAESPNKTDREKAPILQEWVDTPHKDRPSLYDDYKLFFLKSDGDIRVDIATKKLVGNYPDIIPVLEIEAQRLLTLENKLKAVTISTLTRDLFLIGEEILTHYNMLKEKEGALDFDDLILRTLDLLQGKTKSLIGLNVTPWIRFKLDQGIDHILVDEAQDTNPEQWEIIKALCDDFFDGVTASDNERTVFVVGDEKQSIFSFQRASPEKFHEMRQWFEAKILAANKKFAPVDFITSFRSVKSILKIVDMVFDSDDMRRGLGNDPVQHESFRYTQPGLVELWPVFENPEKHKIDPWAPPVEIIDSTSGAAQMANHIGKTVATWIAEKQELESYGREIDAGDILILVRSRTAFVDQLVRALKTNNVPVSGVDRMVLSEQLVVQDLCAAAHFALLPEDDLTLAGLLKSPFIGWDDDRLFQTAYNRDHSLWAAVKNCGDDKLVQWLSNLITHAGKDRPYEFFARILQQDCPADNQSGLRAIKSRLGEECLDPLNEFLTLALNFDSTAIPTLQHFLQAQSHNESQIKRQMEEAGNAVRIMTVHGAKGLQAPIVILPDTTKSSTSGKVDRLLWPDATGDDLPYFCPQSKEVPPACESALAVLKQRQEEESKRLLYVALTRAESRLYIGGYKSSKNIPDDSWYRYIENAFDKLGSDVRDIQTGDEKIIRRYDNPATDNKPDRADKNINTVEKQNTEIPDWLFKPMPQEPFPPRPLVPSRPSEMETTVLSPLQSGHNFRFLRGNITHKLLQILPDLPAAKREAAAMKYVAHPSHNLPAPLQQSIVQETMKILTDSRFAAIFGAGSLAEVPVTGLLDNKTMISGQIDRLLITDTEILIIDYKTNRPPPTEPEKIPALYKRQMQAYREIMHRLYPARNIRTALIWTDGAQIMEIPSPGL